MKFFVCLCVVVLLVLFGVVLVVIVVDVVKVCIDMLYVCIIVLYIYLGKIVKEELEKECGGSGLCYFFDVSGSKGICEIGVDVVIGKVLENFDES